jgi:hypothetical protein
MIWIGFSKWRKISWYILYYDKVGSKWQTKCRWIKKMLGLRILIDGLIKIEDKRVDWIVLLYLDQF